MSIWRVTLSTGARAWVKAADDDAAWGAVLEQVKGNVGVAQVKLVRELGV